MAQEFFINSETLETKVRQLLPSQGGAGAGFDLSATTQIVPIIDLTESAEGSNIRSDLQTSFSLDSITSFSFSNTSGDVITNTGYYRVFGVSTLFSNSSQLMVSRLILTDGVTSKNVFDHVMPSTGASVASVNFDFNVLIKAGEKLTAQSLGPTNFGQLQGCTRQIANLDNELVNP